MSAPIAIVTGASRRVGRVLADGLMADGWQVVAHVHRMEDDVPTGAIRVAADLGDKDCAERIIAGCPGSPRLLVNCAARFAPDTLQGFSDLEFARHMAINVAAPARLSAAFAACPREKAEDRLIVNILDAKLRAPNPDYLSYTLSKAALAELTELSARALAGEGIRVNAIAPALMLQSAGQTADNFKAAHAHNPLGRGVDPADVLTALRFLIESPTITGERLQLDSGQRFLGLSRDVQFLSPRDENDRP